MGFKLKPIFWGFKVIGVATPEKLVSSAYTQHVCTCLSATVLVSTVAEIARFQGGTQI